MTKKKITEIGTVVVVILALSGGSFWFGWSSGRKYPENVVVTGATNIQNASTTTADFSVFWQAWQDINDYYLRNPSTTSQQKLYGSINGLVASLGDPYTEFFSPANNKQFQQDIQGNFGGIGAQLAVNAKGQLAVIAPLPDTPAANAGIKPGDAILDIDASSTDGFSIDEAVSRIRGPIGTAVTLTIMRDGWTKPQDFKITRADIQVPTVDFSMKGNVAYIGLREFTQNADLLFYQALLKAVNNNAKGIVLDLRDDPGGYLEVAVDLAGYFIKPGTLVVKEVGRTVPEQDYKAAGHASLANFPLVVLINGGSASASEILAGALHDDLGTKLVGEQSFGKGTVQELEPLSDGSSIKITIAHWVLPSGKIIDHEGLTPDYVVPITDADIKAGKDPQLDKALEIIKAQIGQ